MAKNSFSLSWNRSTQPRKQRKYRYNAPLHIKQKMMHVHLSPDLRKKYGLRNILVKKGDKLRILRGQFAKKEGKVSRVSLKYDKVYVDGADLIKKDGTKQPLPLTVSNLMIIELNLSDKKRKQKLESKKSTGKPTTKSIKTDKVEVKKAELNKEDAKPKEN
jgi:large subunit ribosomal protein L24